MGKEIIRIYPCYPLQLLDSTYRIMKLNAVTSQFEILGDVYTSKKDCEEEVKQMNEESGTFEYEYEV